jgi:hypothetical protein
MAAIAQATSKGAVVNEGRVGVLVIHGIGEQVPYETLDSAARGFAETFASHGCRGGLTGERRQHADWTEAVVHLDFGDPVTAHGLRSLSFLEFYWAPYTEGKARLASILRWLARTALTPLRYLSANLQAELAAAGPVAGLARVTLPLKLFAREVARAALIYLPFLIVLSLAAGLANQGSRGLPALATQLGTALQAEPSPWWGSAFAILAVLAGVMGTFLVQRLWAARQRVGPGIERTAERTWIVLTVITLALAIGGAARILYTGRFDVRPYLTIVGQPHTILLLLFVGVLALLRWVLLRFVGDIALYVNADARAESYQIRTTILREATAALKRLLQDPEYERVIVFGHSLGSVIAYDAVTELLDATLATPTPGAPAPLTAVELQRLRGIVTFGSPLDKVLYFFREQVRAEQAVRAQILGRLHNFRRKSSGRDYGWLEFAPGTVPATMPLPGLSPGLVWLNVWAPLDPVSGPLRFYQVDVSLRRWYWIWGAAHLRYWRDQAMYELVIANLL